MSLHVWLTFVAATVLLLVIPGPTVLQCIGDALANRHRQNWSTVLGVGVGDAIALLLSLLGAGALLKTSAMAFTLMKTVGGLYLCFLGVKAIRSARRQEEHHAAAERVPKMPESALSRFTKASAVTMLNPKSILFFVAFVPQFIVPRVSFVPQASILLATFVSLAMLNAWMYMSLAEVLSSRLQARSAQKKVAYGTGGVLIAAGTWTLALRR